MKTEKKKKIVIFTDCYDVAFNEIYQILDSSLYDLNVTNYQIDPMVAIPNFSIINAAFQIRLLSDLYGPGTLFLVIMNALPSNPKRIFGKTKSGILFVGNNAGYFNWMFESHGVDWVYENLIDRTKDGRSFGGKHVQVPTACKLLSGQDISTFGKKLDHGSLSSFSIPQRTVVHCDNFGLMKIYQPHPPTFAEGQKLLISINNERHIEGIYSQNLKTHADGTWVVFTGSSLNGLPELGKVRSLNSAEEVNVKVGDTVRWKAI